MEPALTCYETSPDLVARRISGETLLVPVRSGVGDLESLYLLNEVGTFLWGRLDGRRSVADLAAEVSAEFDVTPEEAEADTREFLQGLLDEGLIRNADSGVR